MPNNPTLRTATETGSATINPDMQPTVQHVIVEIHHGPLLTAIPAPPCLVYPCTPMSHLSLHPHVSSIPAPPCLVYPCTPMSCLSLHPHVSSIPAPPCLVYPCTPMSRLSLHPMSCLSLHPMSCLSLHPMSCLSLHPHVLLRDQAFSKTTANRHQLVHHHLQPLNLVKVTLLSNIKEQEKHTSELLK